MGQMILVATYKIFGKNDTVIRCLQHQHMNINKEKDNLQITLECVNIIYDRL